ncbi:MAG: hypothetical protein GY835_23840 [bacterium]|nr:hypothetical protein [bacterium]
MTLHLRPCTVKRAKRWVYDHHRHLKKLQGAMWAVAVYDGEELAGVAAVGHPARKLAEQGKLCVLRVAVAEGVPNACSMLLGACSRAARAMGATDLVTYTLQDEPGTSLRAAGWIDGGLTDGGEYDRPSRYRQPALFPEPKRRWWAPWGERAKQ